MAVRPFQLPVQTHGHYLVEGPDPEEPLPLLVGFHGYGETAEAHLEALRERSRKAGARPAETAAAPDPALPSAVRSPTAGPPARPRPRV